MEGRAGLPLYSQVAEQDVDANAISYCHQTTAASTAAPHFPGRVLMTEPSYFLIERVLHNSVNVMKRQRSERNIPDYLPFHHNEVDEFSLIPALSTASGAYEPRAPAGRRAGAYGELSSRRPCAGLRRASGGPWAGINFYTAMSVSMIKRFAEGGFFRYAIRRVDPGNTRRD